MLLCLAFSGIKLFDFYCDSADWLQQDAGSGCGKSWNRLPTVLYIFCLLV